MSALCPTARPHLEDTPFRRMITSGMMVLVDLSERPWYPPVTSPSPASALSPLLLSTCIGEVC